MVSRREGGMREIKMANKETKKQKKKKKVKKRKERKKLTGF